MRRNFLPIYTSRVYNLVSLVELSKSAGKIPFRSCIVHFAGNTYQLRINRNV